jgi:hypothetical protein
MANKKALEGLRVSLGITLKQLFVARRFSLQHITAIL